MEDGDEKEHEEHEEGVAHRETGSSAEGVRHVRLRSAKDH